MKNDFSINYKLSIIIPVFNEISTIGKILTKVSSILPDTYKEIIVVNDNSNDGTTEWIKKNFCENNIACNQLKINDDGNIEIIDKDSQNFTNFKIIHNNKNYGKGKSFSNGFRIATGDLITIQDADLEYEPKDLEEMYNLFNEKKNIDVIFGSRFYGKPHRSLNFHHYLANRFLSSTHNLFYNQTLTDIECCYKMFRSRLINPQKLVCNDFGIEIELSSKLSKIKDIRIYECGVSYFGRTYKEGKKINWKDGIKAIWYLFKFRLNF